MKKFPLKRIKISNEYIMSGLFFVLMLYLIPHWMNQPEQILVFIPVLILGLCYDVFFNYLRQSMIKCSVSAAITISIIFVLFPYHAFIPMMMASLAGLSLKHALGVMGHNILNPAVVGILVLSLIYPNQSYIFIPSGFTYLAVLLSIPFLAFRPLHGLMLLLGFTIASLTQGAFSIEYLFSSGLFIWSFIIVTDPVTLSKNTVLLPFILLLGLVIPVELIYLSITILSLNLLSLVSDRYLEFHHKRLLFSTGLKSPYKTIVYPSIKETTFFTQTYSRAEILNRIKVNDVRGLGGAGFPTYDKIQQVNLSNQKEKCIIINSVECDPGLVHDAWILSQYSYNIEKGIEQLKRCTDIQTVIVAVKKGKDHNLSEDINVVTVPDHYPMGYERFLIQHVTGKKLSYGAIAADHGILVLNIQTILSIFNAVFYNKLITKKYITIGNLITQKATVESVSLDSKVSDYTGKVNDLVFTGGGLMQSVITSHNQLIDHTTNFIGLAEHPRYKDSFCSKCGICNMRCPSGLQVQKINTLYEHGKIRETFKYHPEECISCGICSYHCLAGKNLTYTLSQIKDHIRTS